MLVQENRNCKDPLYTLRKHENSGNVGIMERQRSMSVAAPPTHPKINYVSMSSVDDTFCDYNSSSINNIASKYVPKELLQHEVRNSKTVKFEGVYEWETYNRKTDDGLINTNTTSVNFSCNMSIASRKYLQKYSLAPREDEERAPLREQNGRRVVVERNKKPDEYEEDRNGGGKENKILDIKKLRSLQKLKYNS